MAGPIVLDWFKGFDEYATGCVNREIVDRLMKTILDVELHQETKTVLDRLAKQGKIDYYELLRYIFGEQQELKDPAGDPAAVAKMCSDLGVENGLNLDALEKILNNRTYEVAVSEDRVRLLEKEAQRLTKEDSCGNSNQKRAATDKPGTEGKETPKASEPPKEQNEQEAYGNGCSAEQAAKLAKDLFQDLQILEENGLSFEKLEEALEERKTEACLTEASLREAELVRLLVAEGKEAVSIDELARALDKGKVEIACSQDIVDEALKKTEKKESS